jgi:hypothetical protein
MYREYFEARQRLAAFVICLGIYHFPLSARPPALAKLPIYIAAAVI